MKNRFREGKELGEGRREQCESSDFFQIILRIY